MFSMDRLLDTTSEGTLLHRNKGNKDDTHARERSPVHASSNGDNPTELQIAAAAYRPIAVGLLIVARSKAEPTMRACANTFRKKKPLLLRIPWRWTRKPDRKKAGM